MSEAPPSAEESSKREPAGDDGLIKAQVYKDPRPAEHFARYHERSRAKHPNAMYEVVRSVTSLYGWSVFRLRSVFPERVPASGAVILAPNHFSFMDHFFLGAAIRRKVRFMAKSQLFKPPMSIIYNNGGVFPVRRGHRDEESFTTANAILARGEALAMYCEGGRSRTGQLGDKARPGIGRLALESGATVVPVAITGSSEVRNWKKGQFPKVTVLYGHPLRFEQVDEPTRHQQQVVADQIFDEIKTLYGELTSLGREKVLRLAADERRAGRGH
jgi:1-acyl-sn-glycerol-3-phosphate acyltransferase